MTTPDHIPPAMPDGHYEPDRRAAPARRISVRGLVIGALVGLVLLIVLPIGVYAALTAGDEDTATDPAASASPTVEPPVVEGPADGPPAGASADFGLTLGDPAAPRTVVIYEDFLCPFCGQLQQEVGGRLDAAIDAGEVMVEHRPLGFLERISDYSPRSANALAVVLDSDGPEVAAEFRALLFEDQPSETGPFPDSDDLVALAVEAGADEARVRPGIESMAFEAWVSEATKTALEDGITSIPAVLVDGEMVEGQTLDDIVAAVLGTSG